MSLPKPLALISAAALVVALLPLAAHAVEGATPVPETVEVTPAPEPRSAEPAASDSKVERATRAVEHAVDETGKTVKRVVEKTKAGVKTAADKTGKVVKKVGEKIESAGSSGSSPASSEAAK